MTQKNIMDNKYEIFTEWFTNNGIKYDIDEDGDLHFIYQMRNFFILDPKDDENFLEVMLPNIWSISDEEERIRVHSVANKLNRQCKALKVFTTKSNTILTVEMFLDKNPDLDDFMERILGILLRGRQMFADDMRSIALAAKR